MRLVIVIAFLLSAPTFSFAQRSIDVLHYTFNIELHDQNDTIHGVAEIELKIHENISGFDIDLDIKVSIFISI